MAIGDKAKTAGMDVVLATDDSEMGYAEINRTRDYIAESLSKSVRNLSHPGNEVFFYWVAPSNHIALRVDVTDLGHIAFTEDVRLTRTELQQQNTEAFSRIYALEQRVAALEQRVAATSGTTTPTTTEGGTNA